MISSNIVLKTSPREFTPSPHQSPQVKLLPEKIGALFQWKNMCQDLTITFPFMFVAV